MAVAFLRSPVDKRRAVLTIVVFSLIAPVGIAIGLGVSQSSDLVDSLLNGFAGVLVALL